MFGTNFKHQSEYWCHCLKITAQHLEPLVLMPKVESLKISVTIVSLFELLFLYWKKMMILHYHYFQSHQFEHYSLSYLEKWYCCTVVWKDEKIFGSAEEWWKMFKEIFIKLPIYLSYYSDGSVNSNSWKIREREQFLAF